jgi:hypothetical protein
MPVVTTSRAIIIGRHGRACRPRVGCFRLAVCFNVAGKTWMAGMKAGHDVEKVDVEKVDVRQFAASRGCAMF